MGSSTSSETSGTPSGQMHMSAYARVRSCAYVGLSSSHSSVSSDRTKERTTGGDASESSSKATQSNTEKMYLEIEVHMTNAMKRETGSVLMKTSRSRSRRASSTCSSRSCLQLVQRRCSTFTPTAAKGIKNMTTIGASPYSRSAENMPCVPTHAESTLNCISHSKESASSHPVRRM